MSSIWAKECMLMIVSVLSALTLTTPPLWREKVVVYYLLVYFIIII